MQQILKPEPVELTVRLLSAELEQRVGRVADQATGILDAGQVLLEMLAWWTPWCAIAFIAACAAVFYHCTVRRSK